MKHQEKIDKTANMIVGLMYISYIVITMIIMIKSLNGINRLEEDINRIDMENQQIRESLLERIIIDSEGHYDRVMNRVNISKIKN